MTDHVETAGEYVVVNDPLRFPSGDTEELKIDPNNNKNTSFILNNQNSSFKVAIAIDFGTDGMGLAYARPEMNDDQIYIHDDYGAVQFADTIKPKLMILMGADGKTISFGMDARHVYITAGKTLKNLLFFERFKMKLYEHDGSILEIQETKKPEETPIEEKKEYIVTNDSPKSSETKPKRKLTARHQRKISDIFKKKKDSSNEKSIIKKKGPLQIRKPGAFKTWNIRYCEIENNDLIIYKSYKDKTKKIWLEKYDLNLVTIGYGIEEPKEFVLVDADESELIEIKCDTETAANEWMKSVAIVDFDETKDDDIKDYEPKRKVNIKKRLKAANQTTYPSELVFVAVLEHIQDLAQKYMRHKGWKAEPNEIQWIITVPAIWNDNAKNNMRQWAIKAGLINPKILGQCQIVYEPDCAALSIMYEHRKKKTGKFVTGDKYLLVDAGGGTVDIACHEVLAEFGVKEVHHPSGGPWGSCEIDNLFTELLYDIFGTNITKALINEKPEIFVWLIHYFQKAKAEFYKNSKTQTHSIILPGEFMSFLEGRLGYEGAFKVVKNAEIEGFGKGLVQLVKQQQNPMKQWLQKMRVEEYFDIFTNEGFESLDDFKDIEEEEITSELKQIGITKRGHLTRLKAAIKKLKSNNNEGDTPSQQSAPPGQQKNKYRLNISVQIWISIFDKIINPTIEHVNKLLQLSELQENCKYLCLVGGLSCSPYFQMKMKEAFGEDSEHKLDVIIPKEPILSVIKGAGYFGLRKDFLKARVLKRSYGVGVIWDQNKAKHEGVSRKYVEKHGQLDASTGKIYVNNCVMILAQKNCVISTDNENDIKKYTVYRKNNQQMKARIPVICSNKSDPKTFTDADVLGEVIVEFDENDKDLLEVVVKFFFGGTSLRVVASKGDDKKSERELELEYFHTT